MAIIGANRATLAQSLLFNPTTDGFWLRPTTGSDLDQLYGALNEAATWNIVQVGIPTELPAFQLQNSNQITSNTYATVVFSPDGQYDLTQDGTYLPCKNEDGGALEFDINPQANTATNEDNAPYATNGTLPGLGSISHLTASITIYILEANLIVNPPQTCQTTQASWGLTVSFTAQPPPPAPGQPLPPKQTLFYRVELAYGEAVDGSFMFKPAPSGFYQTPANQYGWTEQVTAFPGGSYARTGKSQTYSLDMYSSVASVIAAGKSAGMDQNLADWQVAGFYHGGDIFGPTYTRTRWKYESLTAN